MTVTVPARDAAGADEIVFLDITASSDERETVEDKLIGFNIGSAVPTKRWPPERFAVKRNKPKLFIAAYHHDADIFLLPLFMWQLVPEYKVYLRKHPYVPAWELNFLAVV